MSLDKHLIPRGKQRRWYLRVAVPRPLHAVWGKRERIQALGTSDRRQAELLALPILAQWREEERRALGEPTGTTTAHVPARRVPTEAELEQAAVILGYELPREEAEAGRRTLRGPNMYRAHVAWTRAELEGQTRATVTHDYESVRNLADAAAEVMGVDLAPDSEGYAKLCDLLNKASLANLQEQHRRNLGDVEAVTDSPLVQRVREREAAKAKPGETLLELFEAWGAEMLGKGEKDGKRGKRPDTVNQDRKVIQQFAAFVGRDRAVDSITPLEVAEYRDTLRKLPPKWMSKRELRNLDMRAAATKARAEGMAHTAYTTINKHLSTISPLYTWLRKQPRWAGLGNPVDGLFYDDVKGTNPRPPFTTDALNKILGSPLFTGFKADGSEHVPGDVQADDWRRWTPLAAMFTGARIGEIAQLRLGDVRKHRGVWFIQIRHEAKEGLSTKSGESRFAAVHPMLERIGFLAFHQRRLEAAGGDLNAPLFPELSPNARGQISGTPSRWWRDHLARIGVKDPDAEGGDGFGTHSFRHTLADRFRDEAELLDNQIAVVLGHSIKTQTGKYGELPQGTITMHKAWMDAVRFDGVDFSHLVAGEEARKLAA